MIDSLSIGVVVACYPEGNCVDVLLTDDGRRLRGVPVLVPTGTSSTGIVDLPDVGGPADDSRWDIAARRTRTMRAVVAFCRGVPVVLGFLLPDVTQMTFTDKNRRVMRHASDVYTSIDGDGNIEVAHPSGAYVRIGTSPAHEDLTGKDYDKKWAITHNTDKQVHLMVKIGNATLHIDPVGNVALDHPGDLSVQSGGNITMAAGGNVTITGTRIDLNP